MDLAEESAHLREALISRESIDEAKGIIMAIRACTPDEAFAELVRVSSHHNVKVRQLAAAMVTCAAYDRDRIARVASELPIAGIVYNEWSRFLPSAGAQPGCHLGHPYRRHGRLRPQGLQKLLRSV
ncbi:ANTAR domain-containing protein [Angustibacter sp. McL0619]|uniref:ANTAR domain-containing protein n=1 Tax=Angustibacter sp. McL0619 TaxID=3415676 RepID=UPI003CE70E46